MSCVISFIENHSNNVSSNSTHDESIYVSQYIIIITYYLAPFHSRYDVVMMLLLIIIVVVFVGWQDWADISRFLCFLLICFSI